MKTAALLALVGLVALATAPPPVDINGKWTGVVRLTADGVSNDIQVSWDFSVVNNAVSGTVGPDATTRFQFANGTFDGTELTFQAAMPTRLYKFTLTVVDRNRLDGRVASADGKAAGTATIVRDAPVAFTSDDFPDLRGPYLGQKPPGKTAEKFAPGIVSIRGGPDSPPQFTPDGNEAYWSRVGPGGGVSVSRVVNGRWTFPEKLGLAPRGDKPATPLFPPVMDCSPFLFARGQKMLFLSTRPLRDGRRPQRGFFTFWIANRIGDAWSEATAIESFYTGRDDFSAVAEDGTIYLAPPMGKGRIARIAPLAGGGYGEAEPVEPPVDGFPAFAGTFGGRAGSVRTDYLIVSADQPGNRRDLFIMFRKANGNFTAPINMGKTVNSSAIEQFASVSADGKYLFFSSERSGDFDVYWIDAGIIEELRKSS